jgi:hypothetical protein
MLDHFGVTEATWRDGIARDPFFAESETPALVGRAVVALAADPDVRRKAGMAHFAADLARAYGFTDVDGRIPDFFGTFDAAVRALVAAGPPLGANDRFLAWARYCQIHQDPAHGELARDLAGLLQIKGVGPGLGPAGTSL